MDGTEAMEARGEADAIRCQYCEGREYACSLGHDCPTYEYGSGETVNCPQCGTEVCAVCGGERWYQCL